jgi:hypothetical protein
LQHKTFPIYFASSIGLTTGLLALWVKEHPEVMTNLARPNIASVAQAYTLATSLLAQAFNHFVIGPLTSKSVLNQKSVGNIHGLIESL